MKEDAQVQQQFQPANAFLMACLFVASAIGVMAQSAPPVPAPPPPQLGALAPSNIAKTREKPAFDLMRVRLQQHREAL